MSDKPIEQITIVDGGPGVPPLKLTVRKKPPKKPGKPKAPPDKPTVAKGDWVKK